MILSYEQAEALLNRPKKEQIMTDAKKEWEVLVDEIYYDYYPVSKKRMKEFIDEHFIPKEEVKERLEGLKYTNTYSPDSERYYDIEAFNQRIQKAIEECK